MRKFVVFVVLLAALACAGWTWTDDGAQAAVRDQVYGGETDLKSCPNYFAWWTAYDAQGRYMQCAPNGSSPTGYAWFYV